MPACTRDRENAATAKVQKALATGRAFETILAAEAALRIDPRCPTAMLAVMEQDDVRRLVSADYVRLGLARAALGEAVARMRRLDRPGGWSGENVATAESSYREAARAYAGSLSELGHYDEAERIYDLVGRRIPAAKAEMNHLKAILDVRRGDGEAVTKRQAQLRGTGHPNWIYAEIFALWRSGDHAEARRVLASEAGSVGYIGRILCRRDLAEACAAREAAPWAGSELHRLWLTEADAASWLAAELDTLGH